MAFERRDQILLVAAVLCVGLFGADRLVVTPLMNSWSESSAQIDSLRQSISSGTLLLRQEKSLAAKWDEIKARSLPQNVAEAESDVSKAVQRWSQAAQLTLTSQKPRWTPSEKTFKQLEFAMTADGDLEQIARFLYEMEVDQSLPVRFESLTISTKDERGKNLTMNADFTGLIFMEAPKDAR